MGSRKSSSQSKQKKNSQNAAPDPNRALLLDAIHTANLERVRMVLEEICTASIEAYEIACSKLLVDLVDDTSSSPSLDSEWEESELRDRSEPAATSASKKRQALSQRYETCEQCEEEYDVSENYDEACQWHEGELEVDWHADVWAGHDEEKLLGLIDTKENRRDKPEGFRWTCCDGEGDALGCETDAHTPTERKRRKY